MFCHEFHELHKSGVKYRRESTYKKKARIAEILQERQILSEIRQLYNHREEIFEINEPDEIYGLSNLIYKEESYSIISCCLKYIKYLAKDFWKLFIRMRLAVNSI